VTIGAGTPAAKLLALSGGPPRRLGLVREVLSGVALVRWAGFHIVDHVALRRGECDPHPLALSEAIEEIVEVRPRPLEQVDPGGLEEEHLDMVRFLGAADVGNGELSVVHRPQITGTWSGFCS
jgi:hypothetical protein